MKKTFFISLFIFLYCIVYADLELERVVSDLLRNCKECSSGTIAVLPVTVVDNTKINPREVYATILKCLFVDGRLKIVDREGVDKILKEKELSMAGLTNPEEAVHVGQFLGANLIMMIRIEKSVIEMKTVNVKTSQVVGFNFANAVMSIPTDQVSIQQVASDEIKTGWISSDEYQRYFDSKLKMGYYPVEIKGRNLNGWSQYYGVYKINKTGSGWYTHHGWPKYQFDNRNRELNSQGFTLVYKSSFVDSMGIERWNGIWFPR